MRYPITGCEADCVIPSPLIAGFAAQSEAVVVPALPLDGDGQADPIAQPLSGLAVLLLEDNMIVALTVENFLNDLGARRIWTASYVESASDILDRETIEIAILDINIGEDTRLDLARRLRAESIPFFFASGYGEDEGLGADLAGSLIVRKPYGKRDLQKAIITVLGM